MNLLPNHEEELMRLRQFATQCLSPQQERVLRLFSTEGVPQKDVAAAINRNIKTVEKIIGTITQKYRDFYGPLERNASFKRVLLRAAYYYFLKDLLENS